jgi:hypothetical protein
VALILGNGIRLQVVKAVARVPQAGRNLTPDMDKGARAADLARAIVDDLR